VRLRNLGAIGAIVTVVACSAAAAPVATQTARPSDSPVATAATSLAPSAPPASALPQSSPGGGPLPAASASIAQGFAGAQLVAARVSGVAVRRGPSTTSQLVLGVRWDATQHSWVATPDEVRLNVGDVVRIVLGPILRDGFLWYRVQNVTDSQPEQAIQWNADGDGVYGDDAWIATSGPDGAFVKAAPDAGEPGNPPLVFVAGGSGTYLSPPFPVVYGVVGRWALATAGLAPCDLRVVLERTGQSLLGESLMGAFEQGDLTPAEKLPDGTYRVRVAAGVPGHATGACSWALAVYQAQ
jgi:hypothetical protein